jgi:hypothetical protein
MVLLNLEQRFVEGLKEDINIFDGKLTFIFTLTDNDSLRQIDSSSGVLSSPTRTIEIEGCILLAKNQRNSQSVRQRRSGFNIAQEDTLPKDDSVLEVPWRDGINFKEGDSAENKATGEKWRITAIDICTIRSRFRLGISRYG